MMKKPCETQKQVGNAKRIFRKAICIPHKLRDNIQIKRVACKHSFEVKTKGRGIFK